MMDTFVIDSSAWIEYFDGTKKGETVAKIIDEENNQIITTIMTLVELSSIYRKKNMDFEKPYQIVLKDSKIFNLNEEIAKESGKLHGELKLKNKKISFADCLVLFAARKLNAKIITKDLDFKGFKEAIII